jgi:hypothetical protein
MMVFTPTQSKEDGKPDPAMVTSKSACPMLAMVTWRVTDSPIPMTSKSTSTGLTAIDGAPGAAQ